MGRSSPHIPESSEREHPDMPEAGADPGDDVNLEDQTAGSAGPGPGGSKMENLRRVKEQVRVQKERGDAATRTDASERPDEEQPEEERREEE